MSKTASYLYRLGLLQAIALALYHLYLPHQMHWQQGLTQTPAMLSWALLTLNNDWSLLVLLWAIALLLASFENDRAAHGAGSSGLFALFWVFHTAAIMLQPPPLPSSLAWLQLLFVAFSGLLALLIGVGAWQLRRQVLR